MIKIITVVITPFAQNARCLIDTESGEAIVIDPGGEIERLCDILNDSEFFTLKAENIKILLTHAHIDHGGGVKKFLQECEFRGVGKPELFFHKDNDIYKNTIEHFSAMYGFAPGEYENVPDADDYIEHEQIVNFGTCPLKALFTPGHAPGHLSFFISHLKGVEEIWNPGTSEPVKNNYDDPVLIAGDTLFSGSIGRTDLPGGNHQELLDSINDHILVLPDETIVLSGHGPNTNIKDEKSSNPFLVK